MEESVVVLANGYLCLLAWFITGIPSPFMRESYKVKSEIEHVLRVLTNTQLTGVELALAAKDKYRDSLSEKRKVCTDP